MFGFDLQGLTMSEENPWDYYNLYSNQLALEPGAQNVESKAYNRKYEALNCIGRGGYGQVFNARRRSDNRSVVLKFLSKESILNWTTEDGVCISIKQ